MSAEHTQIELADEITLNYKRMVEARAETSDVLELTFEQRMNNALDRYMDLARFTAKAVLLEAPEGS
jgi:hypothetical protein